ncbi:MAG: hypothetical protein A2041_01165 [Bacteroidetes bacterium GWA2_31_9b]|nr:MAG: hypothetical protein A2041_01165 [Bacteroidetes bacterium GWA2_31_9b]
MLNKRHSFGNERQQRWELFYQRTKNKNTSNEKKQNPMNKNLNRFGKILLLLLCLYFFIKAIYLNNILNIKGKYSYGKIIEAKQAKLQYTVYYRFKVGRIEYVNCDLIDKFNKKSIGKWFYVKFDPNNPDNNSTIFIDKPVSDTTLEVPKNGWEYIP